MTRLILVRHGESVSTVARIIAGYRTCTGLSDLGRLQAERLRDRLAASGEIAADVLIASNFARAQQTARIIAPALGLESVEVWPGFGEHDPGPECDGISYDQFSDNYPGPDWVTDPFGQGFPGGETLAEFQHRVGTAVSSVVRQYPDQTVVVACHGGVVDSALRQALKAPGVGAFDVHTLNTAITEFELVRPGKWKLIRFNDHAHLYGLPRDTVPR